MIFTEDYKSVIEDFGKDGKLSLFGVLRIFENIGNRHSDMAGDSVFKYDGSSKAWVLTDWQIEAEEYPSYGDSIKVETCMGLMLAGFLILRVNSLTNLGVYSKINCKK